MKLRILCSLFIGICLGLAAASTAWAQQAALSGTVQDTTGAVLPGASVKLTSKAQGTVRDIITNEAGVYQFSFLPPGVYDLEISLPGFRTLTRRILHWPSRKTSGSISSWKSETLPTM